MEALLLILLHSSFRRRIMEKKRPPLPFDTAHPTISYLKEWMCRMAGLRILGQSIVERRARRMAEKREILRYRSQQLRISVSGFGRFSSRMRHSVGGRKSEKRSGAMESQNANCHLAVL